MPRGKEIMELKVKVRLNDNGIQRAEFSRGLGDGPYRITPDIWTPGKVYETVGLSRKYYEDGSNVPVYFMFDDNGQLRETATEFWQKIEE